MNDHNARIFAHSFSLWVIESRPQTMWILL